MGESPTGNKTRSNGYSLSEMLAVLGIIGVILLFSLPALGERYRGYRIRTQVNEMTADLKAARHTAITKRMDVPFTVNDEGDSPPNQYSYTNAKAQVRTVSMAEGIGITSAPATAVVFTRDGGLDGSASSIVLEYQVSNDRVDQYTVNVSKIGRIEVDYSAVAP